MVLKDREHMTVCWLELAFELAMHATPLARDTLLVPKTTEPAPIVLVVAKTSGSKSKNSSVMSYDNVLIILSLIQPVSCLAPLAKRAKITWPTARNEPRNVMRGNESRRDLAGRPFDLDQRDWDTL